MISDIYQLKQVDESNECEDIIYSNDYIVELFEYFYSEFYEIYQNLKLICVNETNTLGILCSYIYGLRLLIYIIEFIESIEPYGYQDK